MRKRILLFLFISCSISTISLAQGWVIVFDGFSKVPCSSCQCGGNGGISAGVTFNTSVAFGPPQYVSTTLAPVTDAKGNPHMGIVSAPGTLNNAVNFLFTGSGIAPHTVFVGNGTYLGAQFDIVPFSLSGCTPSHGQFVLDCGIGATDGNIFVYPRITISTPGNNSCDSYTFNDDRCVTAIENIWQVTDNPTGPTPIWKTIPGKIGSSVSIKTSDLPTFGGVQYGQRYIRAVDPRFPGKRDSDFLGPFSFRTPPPPIVSVTGTAPICPDGEGSIQVVHGSSTPTGTTFVYTVTQYLLAPGGTCRSDYGPPGNNTVTQATINATAASSCSATSTNVSIGSDTYCSGFIGNYSKTFTNPGTLNYSLNSGSIIENNSANALKLYPGIYKVEVEASGNPAAGCICSFFVKIPPATGSLTITETSKSPPACAGGTDGSAAFSIGTRGNFGPANIRYTLLQEVTPVTAPRTFSVYNSRQNVDANLSGGSLTVNNLVPGNYRLRVWDICQNYPFDRDFTISPSTTNLTLTTPVAPTTKTNPTCFTGGVGDGAFTISVGQIGSYINYTYTLYNDADNTTPLVAASTAGLSKTYSALRHGLSYRVDVSSENGCTDSEIVTLINPPVLNGTGSTIAHNTCNGGAAGRIRFNQTSGSTNLSFALAKKNAIGVYVTHTGGSLDVVNKEYTGLVAGDYQITVTDNCLVTSGEISTKHVSDIIVNEPLPLNFITSTSYIKDGDNFSISCADGSASLSLGFQQGTFPYTVTLLKNGSPVSIGNTSPLALSLGVGNYHVNVSDACSNTSDIILDFRVSSLATAPITASISKLIYTNGLHLTCPESNDGRMEVHVDGGIPGSGSNKYTIELLDGSGNVLVNNVINNNNASGFIATGTPIPASTKIRYQITGLAEGIFYQIRVTDSNTCTKVFSTDINSVNLLLISPAPLTIQAPNTINDFSGLSIFAGELYAVCKRDANGIFTAHVSGGNNPYAINLFKRNNASDPWPTTPVDTRANNTTGIASFPGLGVGFYKVEVTDQQNCTFTEQLFRIKEATNSIQVNNISAALFPNGANTKCYGSSDGSITITATGGAAGDGVGNYTYELSSDNPYNTSISKSASSHTFPSLPAIKLNGDTITYTVALRDDLGCYWSMTNGVDEQLKLSPPDTVEFAWSVASKNFPGYEIPCRGDDAIIRVTSEGGMFPHQITINSVTQQLSSTNDHVDFPLSATTITHYTATFKDNLDCPAPNQLIALTEPASHVAVTVGTIIPPVCINGTDGEIHLSATGGIQFTSPDQYKFIIKRSSIALFDTDTLRGTTVNFRRPANYFVSQNYDVMTIDKHGCIDNASLTMPPNPAPLTLTVNTLVSPSCHGGNDGYITVTASNYNFIGGTSLKFKLSGGHLGNTIIERVVAGETITFTGLEGTDLNGYTGYRAWVEDANSCQDTAYQYLDQSQLQLPSYTPVSVSLLKSIRPSCLNGVDGSLHVQVSGGVPPYKYSLDNLTFTNVNPNGKIFINNLVRESYKFYVTDANFLATQPSCLDTASFSVNKGREIQLTPVMITPVSCVGSNDGAIDLSVTVINRDEDFERSRLKLYWTHDNISSTTSIDTTQDISSLSAGRYTVHASYFVDTLSCTNQKSITIQQPGNGSFRISNITTYDATCGGLTNDGRVVVTVVGGWANIPSYYKLDGGNSQLFSNASFILTGLSPGAHTIEILQANSVCRDVGSFTIEAAMLPLAHHPVRNPSCPLNADGSVRLYSTTANVLFAQEGSNFQSSDEFAGLAAGTYRFVARKIGVNTCVSDPIEVIVADPVDCGTGALSLQLATTPMKATCTTVQDGQAQVMASGGVPPYKFYWDGSTTPAPSIPNNVTSSASNSLAIGIHAIKVYDAVDNWATVSLTIDSRDPLEVLNSTTKTSCAINCNGTAQLLINGGSGAPIISWTDGSGLSTINRQDLCAGEHTFTITDGLNNACSFSGNVLIEHQPDLQIDQLEIIPPVCPGGTDGYINTDVYGGSGNLTITWTNGLPGKKLHGYAAGNFTISVTDNVFGCSTQSTFTLPNATAITVSSISTTPPRCYGGNDGSIQLSLSNVSSPLVQWSNGQIGLTASRLKAGTYEYTVTGSNGCIITGSATLIERPALTVTPAAIMPTCFGSCNGSASITISGGVSPYSIHWSHGQRTSSLVNLCAGNYSYTVTDNFNCQVTGTVSITAPTDIVITKKSEITPLCYGNSNGSLTIEASGGTGAYNYRWTSNQLSPTITGLAAGDYSVTVTDANLCSLSKTFTLTTPSALFFQQDKITKPLCQQSMDGQIIPNPVGGTTPFTFLWENQSSAIVRNQLTAGQYSLQVTDAKGCVVKKNYSLEAPLALEIVNVILLDPVCFDNKNGSISLQAIGGAKPYSFLWNNGAGSMAIKEIGAGNYTVKATDKNGCTIADSYTLKNPQAPIITGIPQKIVICIGSPTTIEPDGEWSTYHWTGPQKFAATTKRIETALAGNYSLTALDVKGCPALANFSIEASKDALIADFLRISEAIVFQPVVFVDISLPEPSHIEWIAPDDKDVVINSQSNGNVEVLFTRTGTFEIGMIASMGSCSSELYKTVIVTEPSDVPGDGGGRLATEDRPITAAVYPNPAGERVAIQVGVPSRDAVELWVISPIENREFFNEKMEGQFDYLIEWDISKLTAGVYYLIYKQHNTTRSERIAVIR